MHCYTYRYMHVTTYLHNLCNIQLGSLSTAVAIAITFVITFILTLIIATVITSIITHIYDKRKFEKILQDYKNEQQNKAVFYEQVGPSNKIVSKNDLELQPNPARLWYKS